MQKRILTLAALVTVVLTAAMAKPRTKAQMQQAAATAISHFGTEKMRMAPRQGQLLELKSTDYYAVMGYQNGGFAVVAADDLAPEVLGVSDTEYDETNENFMWWLNAMNGAIAHAVSTGTSLTVTKPADVGYPESVGPLVTTKWDQSSPYNRMCPKSTITGCVATAMAQVLNFYKAPAHGYGERTIYYPFRKETRTAVYANFSDDYYDWDNMLDTYGSTATTAQKDAVALLMRDCGVATDMQYGTSASGGSGAYSEAAASGLRTYLGQPQARCLYRDDYSEDEWMDIIYKELSEHGPVYYAGSGMQGGHAFVCDGYNKDGKVHMNWGWSGSSNGYFLVSNLNPSGYRFNSGQEMIIGCRAVTEDGDHLTLDVTTPGTLAELLPSGAEDDSDDSEDSENSEGSEGSENSPLSADSDPITHLTITGSLNADDITALANFIGRYDGLDWTGGSVGVLDLSGATLENDELPSLAFAGCAALREVTLPAGLKKMGDGAFADCPLMQSLTVEPAEDAEFTVDGDFILSPDGTELIALLSTASGDVSLPTTITTIHDYALAGCERIKNLYIPNQVATIGTMALSNLYGLVNLRVAPREVPATSTDAFENIMYWNEVTLYVPKGMKNTYSRDAAWKFFKNQYSSIKEYGTVVRADNISRYYGDENPVLSYSVEGDPTEGEPVLTCEVAQDAPAGVYEISIDRGTIEDPYVELVKGTFVVEKVPVRVSVGDYTREVGEENPNFEVEIDLSGLKLGETVIDWITTPTAWTTADIDSPEGTYPIYIARGEATNYAADAYYGTLTVLAPTAVTAVSAVNAGSQSWYTLQGQRTDRCPTAKGVYLHDGKKYVVK